MTSCHYCSTPVDPSSIFTYRKVTGWEAKGTGQTRRGGSDIVARERLEEFACHECVELLRRGLAPMQGTLGDAA